MQICRHKRFPSFFAYFVNFNLHKRVFYRISLNKQHESLNKLTCHKTHSFFSKRLLWAPRFHHCYELYTTLTFLPLVTYFVQSDKILFPKSIFLSISNWTKNIDKLLIVLYNVLSLSALRQCPDASLSRDWRIFADSTAVPRDKIY